MLAAPAAHAFTIENKDAGGQYAVPKFDLEEQAKNFRKDGTGATGTATALYETPLGNGKLQFGVTQGSSNFGSAFARSSGLGPSTISRESLQPRQEHFDRIAARAAELAGLRRHPREALARSVTTAAHTAFAISRNLNF